MSTGMSSDQIIKYEIMDKVKGFPNIVLRIFPDSSNEDQKLVEDGGLTFSYDGIDYGSCDAGWFEVKYINGKRVEIPLIGLEGTDALNRGSSGDAQYQRFHHALGAVKNGLIGIYYLREGESKIQLDLLEMAYNATTYESGGGTYLVIQDLSIVNKILELISKFGRASQNVRTFLNSHVKKMHDLWYKEKFSRYKYDWRIFAEKRSTLLFENYIIKYAGRMRRNFTDGSQRAGHIAVGEMYLSKYLFFGKKIYYLCPRMNHGDVAYLDKHKSNDKEWTLLRSEKNVYYVTRDDLKGLPTIIMKQLESISDKPLKGEALAVYNSCIKQMVAGLKDGSIRLNK